MEFLSRFSGQTRLSEFLKNREFRNLQPNVQEPQPSLPQGPGTSSSPKRENGRRFYLRAGEGIWEYVTAFKWSYSDQKAGKMILMYSDSLFTNLVAYYKAVQKAYPYLEFQGEDEKSAAGTLRFARSEPDSNLRGLYFEFETTEGAPVTKVWISFSSYQARSNILG